MNIEADIKFYQFKEHKIYREKALVALGKDDNMVKAIGNDCDEMRRNGVPEGIIISAPIALGKVEDYLWAQNIIKFFAQKYSGKKFNKNSQGKGMIFVHENCNTVEKKAYENIMYMSGFKEVIYMDEGVEGKTQDMSWEDLIWLMGDRYKLNMAIEITKEQPEEYAKYAIRKLQMDCIRWGLGQDKIQELFTNELSLLQ